MGQGQYACGSCWWQNEFRKKWFTEEVNRQGGIIPAYYLFWFVLLSQDRNQGLVRQCVIAIYKKNIKRLTKVMCSAVIHPLQAD